MVLSLFSKASKIFRSILEMHGNPQKSSEELGIFGGLRLRQFVRSLTADHYFGVLGVFLSVLRVFRGIMGCSRGVPGLFRAVLGCSGGVPGMFQECSGGVPGCSGSVPGFTDTHVKLISD